MGFFLKREESVKKRYFQGKIKTLMESKEGVRERLERNKEFQLLRMSQNAKNRCFIGVS